MPSDFFFCSRSTLVKNRLDRLRDLVPSATGDKLNTAGFLEAAIEHILDLRARVAALEQARQRCSGDCGRRELEVAPRSPLTFPNAHLAYTAAGAPSAQTQPQHPAAAQPQPAPVNPLLLSPGSSEMASAVAAIVSAVGLRSER